MKTWLLLVPLLFSAQTVFSSEADRWLSAARNATHTLQETELWVGGVLGVSVQGESRIQPIGEKAPGSGQAPSSDSTFELGSVSKAFTGVLLAEIAGEVPGLSLTDPLSKFVPELVGTFAGQITLSQLATHTSGLPRLPCLDVNTSYCLHPKSWLNPYVDYTAGQLIEYVKQFHPTGPGPYARSYSNTGFALLGYALSRITGRSFDEMLADRITGPLGMSDTFVNRQVMENSPRDFLGGFDFARASVPHWQWDAFAPTGGILSTSRDMMKFLTANTMPPASPLGKAISQSHALGLGWDSFPGAKVVWKNGETGGVRNLILIVPQNSAGIVTLGNIASAYSDYVSMAPLGTSLPDLMGKAVDQKILESYRGTYRNSQVSAIVEISQRGKFLFASISGATKYRFSAKTDTEFNLYDGTNLIGNETATFETTDAAATSALVLHLKNERGKIVDVRFEKQNQR